MTLLKEILSRKLFSDYSILCVGNLYYKKEWQKIKNLGKVNGKLVNLIDNT